MNNKPKLLRITTVPLSLQTLLQGQANYMQKQGFEVVLASATGKEIKAVEKETGLKVQLLPLTRNIAVFTDLKALWHTYKLIKKEKPDIVHTHTPKAGIVGMLAAKLAGVPIRMHTIAGLPLLEAKGFKRLLMETVERLTSWAATGVYPNSFALQDIIIKNNFAPKHKLKVLANGSSNGINTAHFDPKCYKKGVKERLKTQLHIKPNDLVFTFMGRLVGDKGIDELVSAFEELPHQTSAGAGDVSSTRVETPLLKGVGDVSSTRVETPLLRGVGDVSSSRVETPLLRGVGGVSYKLLLLGDEEPTLDPLLKQTTKAIKQNENIITTGWVEDVRPYLAISDVFVFPSYREGMPNVVLQAGAMGLPQIVTDINGSNEIISQGENGLIIPVKDTTALFAAMKQLLNPDLRTKLSKNARQLIKDKYEQKMVWEALLAEYKGHSPSPSREGNC